MDDSNKMIEARAASLVADHQKLLRDLVKHRGDHRLSQEVIADRMGVSQPTVAAFERYDANPTLATIRRYALAVGVRIVSEVSDDCLQHAHTSTDSRSASYMGFAWPGSKSNHESPVNSSTMVHLVLAGRDR